MSDGLTPDQMDDLLASGVLELVDQLAGAAAALRIKMGSRMTAGVMRTLADKFDPPAEVGRPTSPKSENTP